jgi:transglutaminase-like putative cysteine protease
MTSATREMRVWAGAAFGAAQLAAVAAGLLPWAAGVLTLALTWLVTRRTARVGGHYATAAMIAVSLLVSGVAFYVIITTHNSLVGAGIDPLSMVRLMSWTLIALSLVMAPAWRTVREHRVWLGITVGILIASAAPDSGGRADSATATLVVAWGVLLVAVTMVQRANLVARASVETVSAVRSGRAPNPVVEGVGLVLPVAAAVIAGTLVFVALPGTLGGGGLSVRLEHDLHDSPHQVAITRAIAGVDTTGTGDLDLLVRGSLTNTPLLRVPANSPPLWRATVYSTYTGKSWHSPGYPNESFRLLRGPSVALPARSDDPPATHSVRRRFVVTPARASSLSLLWAPGVPVHLSGSQLHDVARTLGYDRLLMFPASAAPYTVTVAVPDPSQSVLDATTATGTTDGVWTSLPSGLPSRIGTLAKAVTARATSRYQQVTDLEAYLRTHETYSLTSPIPSGNQDAVDDFLFRDHVGFCEQFASAEAVLLRTLGVPARVVTGLAYGTRQGSTRLLRANDAHAWVEVYYPNVGWVSTDPTAGVRLAPATTSSGSWLDRSLQRVASAVPGGGLGVLLLLIVIGLTTALAVRVTNSGRWLPSRSRRVTAPRGSPVLAAFLRFTDRRRASGARSLAETAREYVGRTEPAGRLGAAVAILERESYGADAPDDTEVAEAVVAFDRDTDR